MSDQRPIEEKEEEAETWKMGEGIDELPTWHQEEERERKTMVCWSNQHYEELEVSATSAAFQACDISIMGCFKGMFTCIFSITVQPLKFMCIIINFYPTSKVHVHCYQFISNF